MTNCLYRTNVSPFMMTAHGRLCLVIILPMHLCANQTNVNKTVTEESQGASSRPAEKTTSMSTGTQPGVTEAISTISSQFLWSPSTHRTTPDKLLSSRGHPSSSVSKESTSPGHPGGASAHTAALIGGSVGALIILILIIVVVALCWLRFRRQPLDNENQLSLTKQGRTTVDAKRDGNITPKAQQSETHVYDTLDEDVHKEPVQGGKLSSPKPCRLLADDKACDDVTDLYDNSAYESADDIRSNVPSIIKDHIMDNRNGKDKPAIGRKPIPDGHRTPTQNQPDYQEYDMANDGVPHTRKEGKTNGTITADQVTYAIPCKDNKTHDGPKPSDHDTYALPDKHKKAPKQFIRKVNDQERRPGDPITPRNDIYAQPNKDKKAPKDISGKLSKQTKDASQSTSPSHAIYAQPNKDKKISKNVSVELSKQRSNQTESAPSGHAIYAQPYKDNKTSKNDSGSTVGHDAEHDSTYCVIGNDGQMEEEDDEVIMVDNDIYNS